MSSKTIYWSDYELNILKTLWETSHVKDIIHHFNNKSKKQIGDKAYHLGLKKKISTVHNKIYWTEDEDNFIREKYPKLKTLEQTTFEFNLQFSSNRTSSNIKRRANLLGVVSYKKSLEWTIDDIQKLKELWPLYLWGR